MADAHWRISVGAASVGAPSLDAYVEASPGDPFKENRQRLYYCRFHCNSIRMDNCGRRICRATSVENSAFQVNMLRRCSVVVGKLPVRKNVGGSNGIFQGGSGRTGNAILKRIEARACSYMMGIRFPALSLGANFSIMCAPPWFNSVRMILRCLRAGGAWSVVDQSLYLSFIDTSVCQV